MSRIEEQVEDFYKRMLYNLNIKYYCKNEDINESILNAMKNYYSKNGGEGKNYPDIRLFIENKYSRRIPVMIEVKGGKNKLIKLSKNGDIVGKVFYEKDGKKRADGTLSHLKGDADFTAIRDFAVNGAIHYGKAILECSEYAEVIVIGVNAFELNKKTGEILNPECKAYYMSEKNNKVPKLIKGITATDWSLLAERNIDELFAIIDKLNLSEEEIENLNKKVEDDLEKRIKHIHQSIYENETLKIVLGSNDKLYLFCGLIMAGLKTEGLAQLKPSEFYSHDDIEVNDGTKILNRVKAFLRKKKCSDEKIDMVIHLLEPVFKNKVLWQPINGESLIKSLYKEVYNNIIPCLESNLRIDFMSKILNSLKDWGEFEEDKKNDVVLTPRYVTTLMARLARVNMDSFVWDSAMGSAGFLVSAMDLMIKDAQEKIVDKEKLESKIKSIKENQLLGIEILGNIFILAVLNMLLMGDGSSNIFKDDGHTYNLKSNFPANVFLLNPPYSAEGKGFNFVEEALSQMTNGYACILIQDSAGRGEGHPYTERLLKTNTLIASIKMPTGLFRGTHVKVYIFLFEINKPHDKDSLVTFLDFSEDGYKRQNRKKSGQNVNLKDDGTVKERYAEVEAIVLGKKSKTSYYTEENGLLVRDTISLVGEKVGSDWTFEEHIKIDAVPKENDFKKVVSDYLSWKVSQLMNGDA